MVATGTKLVSSASKTKRSSSYSPMTQRNSGVQKVGDSKTDTEVEKNKRRGGPRRKTSVTSKGITSGSSLPADKNGVCLCN